MAPTISRCPSNLDHSGGVCTCIPDKKRKQELMDEAAKKKQQQEEATE